MKKTKMGLTIKYLTTSAIYHKEIITEAFFSSRSVNKKPPLSVPLFKLRNIDIDNLKEVSIRNRDIDHLFNHKNKSNFTS